MPTHTITFNANGGSGTTAAQVITEGLAANLTANGFTRNLYVFSGWSTVSNGSVTYNDKQAYVMGSSDVTLHAVWPDGCVVITGRHGSTPRNAFELLTEPAELLTMTE